MHSIVADPTIVNYRNKSFEELRFEDYKMGRKSKYDVDVSFQFAKLFDPNQFSLENLSIDPQSPNLFKVGDEKLESNTTFARAKKEADRLIATAKEEAAAIKCEKELWEKQKVAMNSFHKFNPKQIDLNIGGTRYSTSLTTLQSVPGSVLSAMFSEKYSMEPNKAGEYFIDRCGRHFYLILNFLRDRVPADYKGGMSKAHLKELKKEVEYYGLSDLMFPAAFIPSTDKSVLTDIHGVSCFITQDFDGIYYAQKRGITRARISKQEGIYGIRVGESKKELFSKQKGISVGESKKEVVTVCLRCNRGSCISSDNIGIKLTFVEFAAPPRMVPWTQPSVHECESCKPMRAP